MDIDINIDVGEWAEVKIEVSVGRYRCQVLAIGIVMYTRNNKCKVIRIMSKAIIFYN